MQVVQPYAGWEPGVLLSAPPPRWFRAALRRARRNRVTSATGIARSRPIRTKRTRPEAAHLLIVAGWTPTRSAACFVANSIFFRSFSLARKQARDVESGIGRGSALCYDHYGLALEQIRQLSTGDDLVITVVARGRRMRQGAVTLFRQKVFWLQLFSDLTGREAQLIKDVFSAIVEGKVKLSGKKQNSLRQHWGPDYCRKQRMLARIRARHPELSGILKRASEYAGQHRSKA